MNAAEIARALRGAALAVERAQGTAEMRKARPGGRSGNRPKASKGNSQKQNSTPAVPLQTSPQDWPSVIELPVEILHRRPMRGEERSLVVGMFWRLAREGHRLPAERDIIVIDGGRS